MWFPFNFAKNLKGRHFVVGGSKNLKLSPNTCVSVSFRKNVLSSFLLFWSVIKITEVIERNEIASSAAVISIIIDSYKSNFQKQEIFAKIFD